MKIVIIFYSDLYQSVVLYFPVIYINLFCYFSNDLYQSVLLIFQWSLSICFVNFPMTYISLFC